MGVVKFIKEHKRALFIIVVAYVIVLKLLHGRYWASTFNPHAGHLLNHWLGGDDDHSYQNVPLNGIQIERGSFWERAAYRLNGTTVIAIGSAITSRGIKLINDSSDFGKIFPFLRTLLPSFCQTATGGFLYRFYLGHDSNDVAFSQRHFRTEFRRVFLDRVAKLCPAALHSTTLRFVSCAHSGKPAWAQNDAMLDAYLDGADYFYRINDDTQMQTAGWTPAFIGVLLSFRPPRVGVVGPNHFGGNLEILTYDFVHRTHIELFGFYYPRVFRDWWGDEWITKVYRPGRSTKLHRIRLSHTQEVGLRYNVTWATSKRLNGQLARDSRTVRRYVEALRAKNVTLSDGRRIVSMSLYGSMARYTWGAVRNAQLIRRYLPAWRLRVYLVEPPLDSLEQESRSIPQPQQGVANDASNLAVPRRVVQKLRQLDVDVVLMNRTSTDHLAPRSWRLLAVEDPTVDFLLIRDADWRLTDREVAAVNDWTTAAARGRPDSAVLHCLRDHPRHAAAALVDGLWGVRPDAVRRRLESRVGLWNATDGPDVGDSRWLEDVLWPAVADAAVCHDSISRGPVSSPPTGNSFTSSRPPDGTRLPFAVDRRRWEYVGQKYDEHEVPLSDDWSALEKPCSALDESCLYPDPAALTTSAPTVTKSPAKSWSYSAVLAAAEKFEHIAT